LRPVTFVDGLDRLDDRLTMTTASDQQAGAVPEACGPTAFVRLLSERYGVARTKQAVAQDRHLVRDDRKRILVAPSLARLAERGVISLDGAPSLPIDAPAAAGGEPKRGSAGGGYYDEKALTERVIREREELKLAELKGQVLRVDDVAEAMTTAGRRMAEGLDRLATRADEITAAARDGGVEAVRRLMRDQARELRAQMAEALRLDAALGKTDDDGEDA
jgi:hypothetical protein